MHCSVTGNSHSVLSPQGVSKSIKNIVIFAEKYSGETIGAINIILHGGEPMLLGTSYVNRMVGSLEDELPSVRCDYAIQTNLLAYTSHWKTLFEKVFAWKVSSSYDFFSSFRKTKDGRNYFDTWYDKVKQYQDDSGKRLYTICVLSRENVNRVDEIMEQAYSYGLNIKLNMLYSAGKAKQMEKSLYITQEEYGDALIRAYRIWKTYNNSGFLFAQGYDFENIVNHGKPAGCPYISSCVGNIFCLLPDGTLYQCGECSDAKHYCYGNALENELDIKEIVNAGVASSNISGECLDCGICGGGCLLRRTIEHADKTPFCGTYKRLYKEVSETLL
jgi:radical SAM protein with 4Fe4S-binding SPASM domain